MTDKISKKIKILLLCEVNCFHVSSGFINFIFLVKISSVKFNCIVNRFLYTDEESGFCIFIGQLTEKEKDGILATVKDKTDDLNSIFYKLSEPLKNLVWK